VEVKFPTSFAQALSKVTKGQDVTVEGVLTELKWWPREQGSESYQHVAGYMRVYLDGTKFTIGVVPKKRPMREDEIRTLEDLRRYRARLSARARKEQK